MSEQYGQSVYALINDGNLARVEGWYRLANGVSITPNYQEAKHLAEQAGVQVAHALMINGVVGDFGELVE
ncbi:hypothetical protein ACMXZU_04555 [Corynebacterium striatum]